MASIDGRSGPRPDLNLFLVLAHGNRPQQLFYCSKFEVSAALLQLCLCTACQVGPDHEVMKRPDRVEIGEAQGIVRMHNGCRDEQRAYWRMASEQR